MKPQLNIALDAGRLVYVIGPSGAGKDSIIAYARKQLAESGSVFAFPRRYITRPGRDASENHIAMTAAAFEREKRFGRFALDWTGNGLCYGIGIEIDPLLAGGRHVIVNGSRAYLTEATGRYPTLVPVVITIEPIVLRQRLLARGRESADEIDGRLKRAVDLESIRHPGLQIIANNGPVAEAGDAFVALLRSL